MTDSATGLPIEGAVSAGPFSTAAAPATGSYDLMLPAGTYDVTAAADGYAPMTVTGIAAVAGATTNQNFTLAPYQIVLADDVETGRIS